MSWVALKPSEDTIARAREARARAGSVLPPTERFDSEHDYVGPLGELAVCAWLGKQGVEYIHNGGADDRPDIELPDPGGNYGLAVKTQLVTVDFQPSFGVVVPAGQTPHGEVFCFCAYEQHTGRLLILGLMGVARFFAIAAQRATGEALGPRTRARWDCLQLEARRLEPPADWLQNWQNPAVARSWTG